MSQFDLEFLSYLFGICLGSWGLNVITSFICYNLLTEKEQNSLENWKEGDNPIEVRPIIRLLVIISYILDLVFFWNSALIVSFLIWRLLL